MTSSQLIHFRDKLVARSDLQEEKTKEERSIKI